MSHSKQGRKLFLNKIEQFRNIIQLIKIKDNVTKNSLISVIEIFTILMFKVYDKNTI